MKHLNKYENYLTKKYQRKSNYNEYLYDNGFGDRYYICSKCDSYKLKPIPQGGMTPPIWECMSCGEFNYSPKWMAPEEYEIKKSTKKYNI